ncbi:MAG: hypothetical protein ABL921_11685 [Pirellula sp.]
MAEKVELISDRSSSTLASLYPTQLTLTDILAFTCIAAILCALFVPWVAATKIEHVNRFRLVLMFDVAILVFAIVLLVRKRQLALSHTKQRMGMGFSGTIRWRAWPMICAWLFLLGVTMFTAVLSLATAWLLSRDLPNRSWFVYLQPMLTRIPTFGFAGFWIARFVWRAYPNAIEVFDTGIIVGAIQFVPFEKLQVKPSSLFSDRVTIVIDHLDTRVLQLESGLRDWLLANHSKQFSEPT